MIKAADLIDGFRYALDSHWGYIYGATHEMWSAERQAAYVKEYSGDPDRQTSCEYGGKWAGHWVTDCSGLFHYWFKKFGSSIPHGSNSIWNGSCAAKGQLSRGERTDGQPLLPGAAVFTSSGDKHNHIGLYIGNGLVIEAQGTQAGVVTSLISNKKWSHWGLLKGVDYNGGSEEKTMTAVVVLPTGKTGKTVNMRERASTSSPIVKQIPVGSTVDMYEDLGQWCRIGYAGLSGYMMGDYLEYGQEDETGGAEISPEDLKKIEKCLTGIEQAVKAINEWADTIGSIVGRG